MKHVILGLALIVGSAAFANELDKSAAVSQDQIKKAEALPQTTIVRRSKKDGKIQVVHSKDKIAAGVKLTGSQFVKMAMNADKGGNDPHSKHADNLDARGGSRSSWSFGIYYGAGYGGGYIGAGGYGGRGYGGGYGYRAPYYGGGYGGGYWGGGSYQPYYPRYSYGGYNYRYSSYYSYSDREYDYDYCGWDL